MSIYAKLRATPTKPRPVCRHNHTALCITRGASAEIIYPLLDGVIAPEDLDQVTFVFKQDSKLTKYSMFTYLVPSLDTEVKENKSYYTITPEVAGSLQCTITEATNPIGNPVEANYFEISNDPTLNWTTSHHVLDPHFCWASGEDYSAIIFNFSSTETEQFMPSLSPEFLVEYEVALAVNKGYADSRNTEDLVLIEQRPPIEIIDSLYSRV